MARIHALKRLRPHRLCHRWCFVQVADCVCRRLTVGAKESEPSGTWETRVHFSISVPPKVDFWSRLPTKFGKKWNVAACLLKSRRKKSTNRYAHVWHVFGQKTISDIINEWLWNKQGISRRSIWLKSTNRLTISLLILWTLEQNCYCVSHIRKSFKNTFCATQNNLVTRLRCDGKYDKDLVQIYCWV